MTERVTTSPRARTAPWSNGVPLSLGRELGRGGEGVVFDLPAQPSLVAKLYHQTPDAAKQAKLRLMAEHIDSPLRDYAAWPEDTLHDAQGAVIGFTMQRIEGRHPIHMLYSPAQRRETFPQARFDFLVFVARNIAAAFATLHEHGHVLGDVNQGNVLVGADSRVILIDCDSFQIQVGEELHRCPVGVAHFTPPELQSIASFEDITRTSNHDGFGLALLIFHLLMGGRHPCSGVPLAEHVGESLEADIRDFRYAYASDAAKRLIAPPPKSVPIESLPAEIVALFEQAFTERGVESRPAAQQWLAALDALRAGLVQCQKRALHIHAGHLGDCVWCALERRRVQYFGAVGKSTRAAASSIVGAAAPANESAGPDIAAMEAAIAKISLPPPLQVPEYPPLPPQVPASVVELRAVDVGVTAAGIMALLGLGLLANTAMFGAALVLVTAVVSAIVGVAAHQVALFVFGEGCRRYDEACARFSRMRERLADMIDEINDATAATAIAEWRQAELALSEFKAKEASAIAHFKVDAADIGLRKFLQGKLIEQWREPRVTLAERVRLRAAGIETAADFDKVNLARSHLVGEDARAALADWKLQLVRSYRRQVPLKTPGLEDFRKRRSRQQLELEKNLVAAFAKLEKRMKQGSLVLAARSNQMLELKAQLAHQYAQCENQARLLPKPSGRSG